MTYVLTPQNKQVFALRPEQSHPKLSLRRVVWVKLLRWIDKATWPALRKAVWRIGALVLVGLIVAVPQFTLGLLTSAAKWNGYRIPIFLAATLLLIHWRPILRRLRRRRTGNQNTYHGLPVDELVSYLHEQNSFKRDHAMNVLGITQPKYQKIAEELSQHKILVRGENNARVLNSIKRENLVRQFRDGFPLVFDDQRKEWVERDGSFNRWILDRERKEQKEQAKIARLERRKKKLQQDVGFMSRAIAL